MQTYLGDGVYAEFDGYQIWLGLARGERLIAIEPGVLNELVAFYRRLMEDQALAKKEYGL